MLKISHTKSVSLSAFIVKSVCKNIKNLFNINELGEIILRCCLLFYVRVEAGYSHNNFAAPTINALIGSLSIIL